jgi:hypothetical protein
MVASYSLLQFMSTYSYGFSLQVTCGVVVGEVVDLLEVAFGLAFVLLARVLLIAVVVPLSGFAQFSF